MYRLLAGAIVCLLFVYIVECSGNGMCAQLQYPLVHWPCTTGRMCSSLHYIAEHFTRKVEYVIDVDHVPRCTRPSPGPGPGYLCGSKVIRKFIARGHGERAWE